MTIQKVADLAINNVIQKSQQGNLSRLTFYNFLSFENSSVIPQAELKNK